MFWVVVLGIFVLVILVFFSFFFVIVIVVAVLVCSIFFQCSFIIIFFFIFSCTSEPTGCSTALAPYSSSRGQSTESPI